MLALTPPPFMTPIDDTAHPSMRRALIRIDFAVQSAPPLPSTTLHTLLGINILYEQFNLPLHNFHSGKRTIAQTSLMFCVVESNIEIRAAKKGKVHSGHLERHYQSSEWQWVSINQDEGERGQRGLLMHRQGLETHTFMFHPNTSPARSRQLIERENITFTC